MPYTEPFWLSAIGQGQTFDATNILKILLQL